MDEPTGIYLSVVAPAHNERDNITPLADQVADAARQLLQDAEAPPDAFEFVLVNDGSTDGTADVAIGLMPSRPWLRLVSMLDTPPGRGNGQSAAFHAGFRAARGTLIAVLDADLQNDPADLPDMHRTLINEHADMVQGDRSRARRDHAVRKVGSVVGRLFRRWLLGDTIRDTGCSLRLMKRRVALALPLEFKGAHRFIPVTARHMGFRVVETTVTHRPRVAGQTKYGMGITKRALPGLVDCLAIRWMRSRRRPVNAREEPRP